MQANNVSKEQEHNGLFVIFVRNLEKLCIWHSSYLVLFMWVFTLSLSFIKEYLTVPDTYFSSKDNFFNQLFVKWGWAWTLLITGSYMFITSFVYGVNSWKKSVSFALMRLFIGTCFWYFWVNIVFHFVENITGICFDQYHSPNFNITNKQDCKFLKNGSLWVGFDISGHCFLLTYSILIINSELQVQKHWHSITDGVPKFFLSGSKSSSLLKKRHSATYNLVNILFILNCVLLLIWVVMLTATCLYFHTFYSKALGASCGIASWMLTYNEWYKYELSPGLPGSGPLYNKMFRKTPISKIE